MVTQIGNPAPRPLQVAEPTSTATGQDLAAQPRFLCCNECSRGTKLCTFYTKIKTRFQKIARRTARERAARRFGWFSEFAGSSLRSDLAGTMPQPTTHTDPPRLAKHRAQRHSFSKNSNPFSGLAANGMDKQPAGCPICPPAHCHKIAPQNILSLRGNRLFVQPILATK